MRIAPQAVKDKIIEHLQAQPNHQTANIVKLLNLPADNNQQLLDKFWTITKQYDYFRKESYETVFPEMYDLVKPYVQLH
jgi:hypothetical protein